MLLAVKEQRRLSVPPATLIWVAGKFEPGSRVTSCRQLVGGITSSVHALRVTSGREVHTVVLKRWLDETADASQERADREALLLHLLDGTGLPVPRLVACSHSEETDGHAALVMTQVPGDVNLTPKDPTRWVGQMAAGLARIHALRLEAPVSPPWTASPDFDLPAWSRHPAAWTEARSLLDAPAPEATSFIHGDYQPFNLLWTNEKLTGIIDWTMGGTGHPDRDVGHCRLNLAVLFSPDWASEFHDAYEAETGRTVEPWWDIYEITRYSGEWRRTIPTQVANRIPFDVDGMNDRVEQLLITALQ